MVILLCCTLVMLYGVLHCGASYSDGVICKTQQLYDCYEAYIVILFNVLH